MSDSKRYLGERKQVRAGVREVSPVRGLYAVNEACAQFLISRGLMDPDERRPNNDSLFKSKVKPMSKKQREAARVEDIVDDLGQF